MDDTILQGIADIEEVIAGMERGEGPGRFCVGHGLQSRRFRFEWRDQAFSLDFDLPCARLLADDETRRADDAEILAACRMGLLLLMADRDGKLFREGEGNLQLSVSCDEDGPHYGLIGAEGGVLDEGDDWAPLVLRLETAFGIGLSALTDVIWP
ncbi:MAG: hypothetical protein J6U40_04620 [Kiritimatiellae bacterium]|nr:hypothetical protein [Kiritimatiellia bacterium]